MDGVSSDDDSTEEGFVIMPAVDGSWATSGGRFWTPSEVAGRLPAGCYTVGVSTRIGVYLDRHSVVADELIDLPGHGCTEVVSEIRSFWGLGHEFTALGFVHKRGILLFGPPGSGKTSTVQLLIRQIVAEEGGLVLIERNPGLIGEGLKLIRSREPDRPIMVVIEDIDGLCSSPAETSLLQLLDGENQVGGVVFVATTNYLDRLPDRIAARPSRFDLVLEVGMPGAAARLAYIHEVWPASSMLFVDGGLTVADQIVEKTEGYSVAHLKEMLILHRVYRLPIQAAVDRIEAIRKRKLLPAQAAISTIPKKKPVSDD